MKPQSVAAAPPHLPAQQRAQTRMPTSAEKVLLVKRDGYHCHFCGIPVIRSEVRARIRKVYPHALPWGKKNLEQHAAFQAMWATYDHVLPHTRGGTNNFENMIITCQPCNCARMDFTLDEVGLIDPRTRQPVQSTWDGLERFR